MINHLALVSDTEEQEVAKTVLSFGNINLMLNFFTDSTNSYNAGETVHEKIMLEGQSEYLDFMICELGNVSLLDEHGQEHLYASLDNSKDILEAMKRSVLSYYKTRPIISETVEKVTQINN